VAPDRHTPADLVVALVVRFAGTLDDDPAMDRESALKASGARCQHMDGGPGLLRGRQHAAGPPIGRPPSGGTILRSPPGRGRGYRQQEHDHEDGECALQNLEQAKAFALNDASDYSPRNAKFR